MENIKNIVKVAVVILMLTACSTKCDYNSFLQNFNKKFSYMYTKDLNSVVDELLFTEDYYIHTTIINDTIISDTNKYEYNTVNGKITVYNFINRYDRATGETFIYNPSTTIFQYRCNEISLGDIYYVKNLNAFQ